MLKRVFAVILVTCLAIFVCATWHWPFVGDETFIRYVNFLMRHGMEPYRDIVDINMPGAYAVDWLAVHVFGSGSLAWRLFDFTLMSIATAAALFIAWPYDWFAGIYCGVLFFLIHGRDGVAQAGQRDLTISVLVLAAVALLLYGRRSNRWGATVLFGFLCGFAATIKPTALPLGLALLLMLALDLRRKQLPFLRPVVGGLIGLLFPLLLALLFLIREHAVRAFLYTLETLIPYHASIGRLPLSYFLWHSFAAAILPIAVLWLAIAAMNRDWQSWERAVLLVCLAFGYLALVVQGKGYPYHRYLSEAFLLLLAGIDFTVALRGRGAVKVLGAVGLVFGVLVLAPVSTMKAARYQWKNQEFRVLLENDLKNLGGKSLSGHVQCMDTIGGCIATLNAMHLVQATGYLYDCYLFADKPSPVQEVYRAGFWAALQKNPPQLFIVTNEVCMHEAGAFEKVQRWPQFDEYLRKHYTMDIQRTPPDEVRWWSRPMPPASYRIYVRKTNAP